MTRKTVAAAPAPLIDADAYLGNFQVAFGWDERALAPHRPRSHEHERRQDRLDQRRRRTPKT